MTDDRTSDTPRTDALAATWTECVLSEETAVALKPDVWNFARQLERELAALRTAKAEPVAWAYYWPDGELNSLAALPWGEDKPRDLREVPLYTHPPIPEGYVMVPREDK